MSLPSSISLLTTLSPKWQHTYLVTLDWSLLLHWMLSSQPWHTGQIIKGTSLSKQWWTFHCYALKKACPDALVLLEVMTLKSVFKLKASNLDYFTTVQCNILRLALLKPLRFSKYTYEASFLVMVMVYHCYLFQQKLRTLFSSQDWTNRKCPSFALKLVGNKNIFRHNISPSDTVTPNWYFFF